MLAKQPNPNRLVDWCRRFFIGFLACAIFKEVLSVDNHLEVRKDLVGALVSVLSLGIRDNQLDGSEKLLSAIVILNPDLKCIDEFRSFIAIKRGNVREALQINLAAPSDDSKWYVMMALCLKLADDPTWHSHACQALELNDGYAPSSHDLARMLLGQAPSAAAAVSVPDASTATTGDFPNSVGNYFPV